MWPRSPRLSVPCQQEGCALSTVYSPGSGPVAALGHTQHTLTLTTAEEQNQSQETL